MKKRILTILLILLISLTISGCGGGFFEEETLQIESITTRIDPVTGAKLLVITYNDETLEPIEFEIPKGDEGNGIQSIEQIREEGETFSTVKITYTDEKMEPIEFPIKDGVSISRVAEETDSETGDRYLRVYFDDGTESDRFLLPQGEQGNGIEEFVVEEDELGNHKLTFTLSDGVVKEINIPAPERGETGRGIQFIEGTEENGKYVLKIHYTKFEGEEEEKIDTISFDKPVEPNYWFNGTTDPNLDQNIGQTKDGDLYFDTVHKKIYKKEYGYWLEVVNFNDSVTLCNIKFYLNDEDDNPLTENAHFVIGSESYRVKKNTYFTQNDQGPIPHAERPGFKFLGWYTTQKKSITSGKFDDLTPILGDLNLYAWWDPIE